MALSGTYYGPWLGSGYQRVYLTWSATQDVANNTSTITASLVWENAGNTLSSSVSKTANITIDGTTYSGSGTVGIAGGTAKTIMTASKTISHNADGTRSFSISGAFDIKFTLSGTYYASTSASGTGTLDSIARATTPELSVSSITIGNAVTVNTPRATGTSFTHKIYYKWPGGGWELIAENVATSFVWTTNINMCSGLPNSTSGNITIAADTYSGSSFIGSKTVDLTLNVPSFVIPTVSLAKSGVDLYSSKYVQGRSKVYVALTDDGSYGSSIVSRSTTVKSGANTIASSSSKTFTSGVINYSGTVTIETTVTDSRGRTASASTTISVVAYSSPQITAFSAFRSNSNGSANPQGAYIRITGSSSISSIDGTNSRSTILRYRLKGGSAWIEPIWNNTLYTPSLSVTVPADVNGSFEVQIYTADYFSSTTQTINVGTAFVLMDFNSGGSGVAFGKVSEKSAIEFAMDVYGSSRKILNPDGSFYIDDCRFIQGSTGAESYYPKPDDLPNMSITPLFSHFDDGADWRSGLLFKGWTDGYSAWRITGPSSTANDMFFLQSGVGATWRPKVLIWHSGNCFPMVESGSNWSGRYIRFADGTMMCWGTRTFSTTVASAWGSLFYHDVQSWTFPAAFVGDKPVCSAFCTDSGAELLGMVPNSTLTNMTFYGLRPTSVPTSTAFNFRVFAIGRWK